jgi:phenylacetic acid degradation protein PaaD
MELLGIEVVSVAPEEVRLKAVVRLEHLNLHGTAHGGFVYTLADAAFALISNARARAVATSARIDYFRPLVPGDEVMAVARPLNVGKRLATYAVEVFCEHRRVAHFVGTVYHLEER